MPEQAAYLEKKAQYERMLTVYGRKAVLETLRDESLQCHAVHLADSNRNNGIVNEIVTAANARQVVVKMHSRAELARISKNGKQDQGVAVDVLCPAFQQLNDYLAHTVSRAKTPQRLLALDGISNPQNLGMIIRSAAAGAIDGIVLAQKGNAALGPLVIKASAGTLYKAPILRCNSLLDALAECREHGAQIFSLEASAPQTLFDHSEGALNVYVLGNETQGVSKDVSALADMPLSIPMRNGVESLNVAVTASLIAFAPYLER